MAEFTILLLLQIVILVAILLRVGFSSSTGPIMFGPGSWFVLLYTFSFVLPQLVLPGANFPLIGVNNRVAFEQLPNIIETQKFLCVFLACFACGFVTTCVQTPKVINLIPLTKRERRWSLLLGVIGFCAVVVIVLRMNPDDPRSMIVSSHLGRLLYGISFWLTLGYIVLAAYFFDRGKYILLVILTVIFGYSLLLLGGRGRVLWPLVGVFVWSAVSGRINVRLWKLIVCFLVLGVFLQALDPLLFYLRGYENIEQATERFLGKLNVESFFLARVFDSFHNVATIYCIDEIRPDLRYLINGSQEAFMESYFPAVAKRKIGFPATLPGGLWIAGRWPAVIIGSLCLGVFFGFLTRVYKNLKSEFELIVYCIAMPWLALIGGSYLESQMKMLAAIGPGLGIALWLRRRTKRAHARKFN